MLYSLGRCGSTLLSQAFNATSSVLSLSEPDVFFNLTALRDHAGSKDEAFIKLTKTCLKLLCKPSLNKVPTVWLLKFRGFSIEVADLVHKAAPDALNLFLYRNAETWAKSMARVTKLVERNHFTREPLRPLLYGFPRENFMSYLNNFDASFRNWNMLENFALGYLSMMNRYLEHIQANIPFTTLKYEDLSSEPQQILQHLFQLANLEQAQIPNALNTFSKDSQEGTRFSQRANPKTGTLELNEEQLHMFKAVLEYHDFLSNSDVILPNTIRL